MEIHIDLDVMNGVEKLKETIDELRSLASVDDKLVIRVTVKDETNHCNQTNRCESQSFYADSTNHPYVVQLPVKDLVDLYVARAEILHRSSHAHKK